MYLKSCFSIFFYINIFFYSLIPVTPMEYTHFARRFFCSNKKNFITFTIINDFQHSYQHTVFIVYLYNFGTKSMFQTIRLSSPSYRRSLDIFFLGAWIKFNFVHFELFWKKFKFFEFPWCSTREDLSIDVSITNVGLILTKLRWFLFSGCGQTDRHGFGILIWKHVAHKKFQLKAQN